MNSYISAIIMVAIGIGGYFVKDLMTRLFTVEQEVRTKPTEAEVRQILADKIEPIHSDLAEIKESLRQVYELLVRPKQ